MIEGLIIWIWWEGDNRCLWNEYL